MALNTCPVCLAFCDTEGTSKLTVKCPRCGVFSISEDAVINLKNEIERTSTPGILDYAPLVRRARANASAWLRQNSGYEVSTEDLPFLRSIRQPSVPNRLNTFLLGIASTVDSVDAALDLDPTVWIPRTWSQDGKEAAGLLSLLVESGFVHNYRSKIDERSLGRVQLTAQGWERADELSGPDSDSKTVFVAMRFNDEMTTVFESAIKPAIESAGFDAHLVGGDDNTGRIDDEIIAGIRACRFMVSDMTGHRPSVYYEAGHAHGLGKDVLFTCHADDFKGLHFDIRQHNCIKWKTADELREKLEMRIRANFSPDEGSR